LAFLIRLITFIIVLSIIWRLIKAFLHSKRASSSTWKSSSTRPQQASIENPYKVLGVGERATNSEIKEAYRKKLQEYHPDKVNHLGPELKSLAGKKTAEIIEAFNTIKHLRNDLT
jgi:DnaJ-class molecular chaperone